MMFLNQTLIDRAHAYRILLAAILAIFYILEALAVRNVASDTVKAAYIIWPREGWAFGMGAALLWLLISFFCCCAFLLLLLVEQSQHASGRGHLRELRELQQQKLPAPYLVTFLSHLGCPGGHQER